MIPAPPWLIQLILDSIERAGRTVAAGVPHPAAHLLVTSLMAWGHAHGIVWRVW